MLLKFKVKNYKSFYEEMCFSMEPAPKQKDLSYSILKEHIKGHKSYKALSSAVIYGANASGKSNIIGAMDTFRQIVRRGNILNDEQKTKNYAANALELIPNNVINSACPTEFAIKFVDSGLVFDYKLVVYIGTFLDAKNEARKIVSEKLFINNVLIFDRNENDIELGDNISKFKDSVSSVIFSTPQAIDSLLQDNISSKELFLSNGFKSIVSKKLSDIITDWFINKFMTIYDAGTYRSDISPDSHKFEKNTLSILGFFFVLAQTLGIASNHIGYVYDDNKQLILSSVFQKGEKGAVVKSEVIESLGTLKFINLLFPIVAALKHGGTLIVDEFDNSLHPKVVMNIVSIFHNDEININKAQLIFNTHNPIFLNSALFRRDEIKFVERDDNGFSTHYSLSDFSLPCKKRVRRGADYMKNYFINKYGAIKNIDISPILEKLISSNDFHIKEMGCSR